LIHLIVAMTVYLPVRHCKEPAVAILE